MINLLQNDIDPVVRNSAARALGKLYGKEQNDEILDALIQALKDNDYYVRSNACWSLGKTKDARAISNLIEMVDPNQRFYSNVGDGKTENTISEKDASEKLREEGVKFSDVIVEAIKALGYIKDPLGVPVLIKALDDDIDGNVRCAACLALGKIKDNSAVPALIDLLKREKYWYVRRDAIKALMKMKDPRSADELVKKASDMYDEVRDYAVKALVAIGKPAAPQIIRLFLNNPENNTLKNFISQSLSKEEMKDVLESMLEKETDKGIKEKYKLLLEKLT